MRGDVLFFGGVARRMIIDCHGHYTTAPESHNLWRKAQVAGTKRTNRRPVPGDIGRRDSRIHRGESTANPARTRRRHDDLLAARVGHGAPRGRRSGEPALVARLQRLIKRVVDLYPDAFIGVGQLPSHPVPDWKDRLPNSIAASTISASSAVISVPIERRKWSGPPLTDRYWYPIYEKMVELDVPAMIHVSSSCNPNFHAPVPLHQRDTTAFMQLIQGDLFANFPTLRLSFPRWRRRALPLGTLPRTRRHARQADLGRARHENVYFDTCVYHSPGSTCSLK